MIQKRFLLCSTQKRSWNHFGPKKFSFQFFPKTSLSNSFSRLSSCIFRFSLFTKVKILAQKNFDTMVKFLLFLYDENKIKVKIDDSQDTSFSLSDNLFIDQILTFIIISSSLISLPIHFAHFICKIQWKNWYFLVLIKMMTSLNLLLVFWEVTQLFHLRGFLSFQ